MPLIWKATFQEPDNSGLMDRLLGEMERQKVDAGHDVDDFPSNTSLPTGTRLVPQAA